MSSNATDTDDFELGRPVVLGPIIAVAVVLVALLGIGVFLYARNRQARISRLRERIGLAESRVNALLKIHQVSVEMLKFYFTLLGFRWQRSTKAQTSNALMILTR